MSKLWDLGGQTKRKKENIHTNLDRKNGLYNIHLYDDSKYHQEYRHQIDHDIFAISK